MEPVFTIQYGEFAVADYLAKTKELKGTSVFIPSSRQEKGIDLLLYRFQNGSSKILTVQVKMSRAYYPDKAVRPTTKRFPYYLWFNRFTPQDNADWFILVGIYARHAKSRAKAKANSTKWDTIMLAFTHDEMVDFMNNLKQKTTGKADSSFGFGFDDNKSIFQTRGSVAIADMNNRLIEKRINEILNSFH